MTTQARGSFEVQISPRSEDADRGGATLGRMRLDKQFHGDLEATSIGTMLTAMTEAGSAVYVAIERVTGTLHGRNGSFALVHKGTATAAGQALTIDVVPDSGSDDLRGLSGTMTIEIVDGAHGYALTYTL